jgi:hypothetical protein
LENEIKTWNQNLKDLESNFLKKDQAIPSFPPKKKTRRSTKTNKTSKGENGAMAELAATLEIDSFIKVYISFWDLKIHSCTFKSLSNYLNVTI